MGESKARAYAQTYFSSKSRPGYHNAMFTLSSDNVAPPIRIPLPKTALRKTSESSNYLIYCKFTPEGQIKRLRKTRRAIRRVTTANAIISWAVTMLNYFSIHKYETDEVGLDVGIAVLTVLQVILVVAYWDLSLKHEEVVRVALAIEKIPVRRLLKSRKSMLLCAMECTFHFAFPMPGGSSHSRFFFFGQVIKLSINDMIFILIVLRNYHSVRFLYWFSHLSGLQVRFYAHIWKVKSRWVFILKCYLAEYAVNLIMQVSVLMMVIAGLLDFSLEHEAYSAANRSTWDHFWLVSITQTTVGYGDIVPQSFFGQVTLLASCFFGIFLMALINAFSERRANLKPKENDMYYHITHTQNKTKHRGAAIVLVQRWWRFMKARVSKRPKGELVLQLFAQLNVYRSILLRCHSLQFLRLSRQTEAFGRDFIYKLRSLRAHLRPTVHLQSVSEHYLSISGFAFFSCLAIRNAAAHANNCSSFLSTAHSFLEFPTVNRQSFRLRVPSGLRPRRRKSTIKFAKAKYLAYANVLCRSARGSGSSCGNSPKGSVDEKTPQGK